MLNREARTFIINKVNYKEYFFKFLFIKKTIKRHQYKAIVSVDILNAVFCSLLKVKTDFLSLELTIDERHLHLITFNYVNCVLIQSIERYQYLFKNERIKTFFV